MPEPINPFAISGTESTKPLPTNLYLRASGQSLPLVEGRTFTTADLGLGDETIHTQPCATVVRNPANPQILGLKNVTNTAWHAVLPSGEARLVEPGKSVKLAEATRIAIEHANVTIVSYSNESPRRLSDVRRVRF